MKSIKCPPVSNVKVDIPVLENDNDTYLTVSMSGKHIEDITCKTTIKFCKIMYFIAWFAFMLLISRAFYLLGVVIWFTSSCPVHESVSFRISHFPSLFCLYDMYWIVPS